MRTVIDAWHAVVRSSDPRRLDEILAADVVFHSPVVHTPQVGKAITRVYLSAALKVLSNRSFHFVREIVGQRDAMLEFLVEIDGISVNGVDLIKWNEAGRIVEFKVLIRPLK